MTQLQFIGTGSAFTLGDGNYQSNMVLQSDTKQNLLIDCGSDARKALFEQGLSYKDVHSVYISHLHSDHIGGLEWLAFVTKYDPSCAQPILYISPDLAEDLWTKSLSGGLCSSDDPDVNLSTYFQVELIQNQLFHWEGLVIEIFHAPHVCCGTHELPSYGLHFIANGKNVLLSTDIKFLPEYMKKLYDEADIIFQDCETHLFKTGVHAHYTDLRTLDKAIKNKMWLYHYQPGALPDAVADGFKGFVKKGQIFDFTF